MTEVNLPTMLRPRHSSYRKCSLGVDLPASFYYDIKAIDDHLYPVWHAYSVLWEHDVMNQYSGSLEDYRREIHYKYGELNFGHVLLQSDTDAPLSDPKTQGGGMWHLWRFCWPHGWAHVIAIESKQDHYLHLVAKKLHLQAKFNDKYGHKGYSKYLDELDEAEREAEMATRQELLEEIHEANSWLINSAMDNFARGKTAATNPMKETITSFSNQTRKSKTVRSLEDFDKESGIILPDQYK